MYWHGHLEEAEMGRKLRFLCSVGVVALHALSATSQDGGAGNWALPTGNPRNAEELLDLQLRTLEALESSPTPSAPSPSPGLGAEARGDEGPSGGTPLGRDPSDTPQIIDIRPSSEDGVLIYWQSEPDAIYQVEFVPDPGFAGAPQVLIDDYPSHGSMTFWQDTGDHFSDPEVPHPRDEGRRFYRIARTGYNTAPAPAISITSHSTGQVVSGEIEVEVSVSTDQLLMGLRLYVDGDEYNPDRDDTAVFPINTYEWSNGPHTLFAVATVHSDISMTPVEEPIDIARAASPCVELVFDNYVSRFRLSDFYFHPAEGDIQHISAQFADESDWVLTIKDTDDVTVRSFSGTGEEMNAEWDGTDELGSSLPYGIYDMSVSAAAVSPGGGYGTATRPRRRGPWILDPEPGTFGVAYQGHHPIPPPAFDPPPTGRSSPWPPYVEIPFTPPLGPGRTAHDEATGFSNKMMSHGWTRGFFLGDDALTANALRKPTIFNEVNIGLLIGHGTYGTTQDWNHGIPCKLTYFPVYHSDPVSYEWVRLPEYDLGSDHLRWMAIDSCHALHDEQFQDMWNHHLLPINEKLHLLLGFETTAPAAGSFPYEWARAMDGYMDRPPKTVIGSFVTAAALTTYKAGTTFPSGEIVPLCVVRVAGWRNCWGDKLLEYQTPNTAAGTDWEDFRVNE
jgi:hypothetical protein